MAQIFTPSGSSNTSQQLQAFYAATGNRLGSAQLDTDGDLFQAPPGQGATPAPLTHLLTIEIDPTWYAQYGALWKSPLGKRIAITYMDTDSGIIEAAQARYADIEVIGRAQGFKTYMGTANRAVQLTFHFQAQGISGVDLAGTIDTEVVQPSKWLDALNYPLNNNGISVAPPPVILTLGQLLSMRAIVAPQVRWLFPVDPNTMLPMASEVTCEFIAVDDQLGDYNFDGPNRFDVQQFLGGVDGTETAFQARIPQA